MHLVLWQNWAHHKQMIRNVTYCNHTHMIYSVICRVISNTYYFTHQIILHPCTIFFFLPCAFGSWLIVYLIKLFCSTCWIRLESLNQNSHGIVTLDVDQVQINHRKSPHTKNSSQSIYLAWSKKLRWSLCLR